MKLCCAVQSSGLHLQGAGHHLVEDQVEVEDHLVHCGLGHLTVDLAVGCAVEVEVEVFICLRLQTASFILSPVAVSCALLQVLFFGFQLQI